MPELTKEVKRLFEKSIISKDLPLKTSFGKGPSCDPEMTIECMSFVGNARAKISVRLFKVVRPAQVISSWEPVNVQTQGVMRKESGQATALTL